jgi:hypothetical protein
MYMPHRHLSLAYGRSGDERASPGDADWRGLEFLKLERTVSMAMRKSPCVVRSRSLLVVR